MSKRAMCGVGVALLVAFGVSMPSSAQVCAPLDNGRVADAFHEGTVIFWDPVVEFQRITLTISGPCEDIVKVFTPKDQIMFDIREIERITDGQYTWTLRREASIDPGVQKDLQEARFSGKEDDLWWSYFQQGKIPEGPYSETGNFTVDRGVIVDPGQVEKGALASKTGGRSTGLSDIAIVGGVAGDGGGENTLATKDIVHNDDIIIHNSLCVGFDCVSGEVFNADTIRLKENNLRIHFQDTSGGSFPTGDWRLEANSNANGGLSYFAIQDADNGRNILLVEDGAPSDSVRVDSSGRVGFGTANPVVELHSANGDTPALRLEQTTASGFAAQTWDVAGNETSFFVRDATNGSTLPFRIRPGASSNRLVIDTDGQVGVGVLSPERPLDVVATGAPDNTVLEIENNGGARMRIRNGSSGETWNIGHQLPSQTGLTFSDVGDADSEFLLDVDGNLTITGELTTGGTTCGGGGCDLVFSPDTERTPLAEHAAAMWANGYLPAVGPTPENQPFNLTTKVGGMLHELEMAHIYIAELHGSLEASKQEIASLSKNQEELDDLRAEIEDLRALVRELADR